MGITVPVLKFYGNGNGIEALQTLLSNAVSILLIIGFVLALFYFIMGAYRWITGGSDKQKLQQAQDQITMAIVGLIILASVWAVSLFVGNFLGFQIFGLGGTPTSTDARPGRGF